MSKKINLLLDLDQTLISAETPEEIRVGYEKEKKTFDMYNMDNEYYIYCRPKLQEFLDYVFENFNVSVWTAASKDYALFIIEKIIVRPHRKLDFIFFSYHCDISKNERYFTKHLTMLWDVYGLKTYNEKNTFILDDNLEEVYQCQTNNCIVAPPFEFTRTDFSKLDNFFDRLIPELDKLLQRIKKGDPNLCNLINKNLGTNLEFDQSSYEDSY